MEEFYVQNAIWYQTLVDRLATATTTTDINPSETQSSSNGTRGTTVAVRIRPQSKEDIEKGLPNAIFTSPQHEGVVNIHGLHNHPRGRPTLKSFQFNVDKVYTSEAATQDVFEDLLGKPVNAACSRGIGTVFAYGQTGSGKTHTMSEIEEMVAAELMNEELREERKVSIAFIELFGDSVFDLLYDRSPVVLREDDQGVIHWRGVSENEVKSCDEMTSLMARANAFRRTESTARNDTSSRSHAICRISVKEETTSAPGYLYLVDLAGSEAARDIATHGAGLMRETREINLSLSVLKDCIRGKADLEEQRAAGEVHPLRQSHLPIRRSALTKVLKHVLDDQQDRRCETVIIACLNPSLADVGPSKNTLRYAEMIGGHHRHTLKKNIWER